MVIPYDSAGYLTRIFFEQAGVLDRSVAEGSDLLPLACGGCWISHGPKYITSSRKILEGMVSAGILGT